MNSHEELALKTASESPCEKRKVGAVLVYQDTVLSYANNYHPDAFSVCELADGSTDPKVIHAEVATLDAAHKAFDHMHVPLTLYVTHNPCTSCLDYINHYAKQYGIVIKIKIVEQFMKFDSGKLAYDLIPPTWIELDAEVLTKGAQKYKPNNWRQVKPEEIMRYYSAAMRHIQDWKKFMDGLPEGHLFDDGEMGIGTHHLANARTNLGFLLTLTETLEKAEEIKNGNS